MSDWKGIELFEREFTTLKQLDHAAIPKFIELIKENEAASTQWHIVQEKIEGETISLMLENKTKFNETELVSCTKQILDILSYLQDFSPPLFHRDIKPSNVVMSAGNLSLIDFGSVRYVVPNAVGGSTIVGTNGYMAPEQLMGRADMTSDLFGLGMTLIHMITGKHPNDLPMERMKIQWEDHAIVKVGDGFANFLNQLTQPDPTMRFPNAAEALLALQKPTVFTSAVPSELIENTPQTGSNVTFRRTQNRTFIKTTSKSSAKVLLLFPFFGLLCLGFSLMNSAPSVAALIIFIAAIGLGSVGMFAISKSTQFRSRFSIALYLDTVFVDRGTNSQGEEDIYHLDFEAILNAKTEMKIENKKEILLPLVIQRFEVTNPLGFVDRASILEEMKSMVRRELERRNAAND